MAALSGDGLWSNGVGSKGKFWLWIQGEQMGRGLAGGAELEGGVFEHPVEEEEEFAHGGGEGDQRFLPGFTQALVEGARRMGSWRTALSAAM